MSETDCTHIEKGKSIVYKIVFICAHNSCRPKMPEGLERQLTSNLLEGYSAGAQDYSEVKPLTVEVRKEIGISKDYHYPKLTKDIPEEVDIMITLGCGAIRPSLSSKHEVDRGPADPW